MIEPINKIKDWMFSKVHGRNLVYNTCWEDPRCDRRLLGLTPQSKVVMITSAGCNALEYLLDDPAEIHCVDVNYRQNALLELKKASLNHLDYTNHFQFFGGGSHPEAQELYKRALRPALPDFAQRYWDKKIRFFSGKKPRRSFYYFGTSGTLAWVTRQYVRSRKRLRRNVDAMFQAPDLAGQTRYYDLVERDFLGKWAHWFTNRHLTMSLAGVPRSQQDLFRKEFEEGALGYIKQCLRQVFTQIPIQENYFWQVYLYGHYTPQSCPGYLAEPSYPVIRERSGRIQTHTTTLAGFLKENPGPYSHFILLDHQDWLAANDLPALEEEWRLILACSLPGTRILMRSAASEVKFFPSFVLERVKFDPEAAAWSQANDRVGTYASTYIGVVIP